MYKARFSIQFGSKRIMCSIHFPETLLKKKICSRTKDGVKIMNINPCLFSTYWTV